MSMNNLVLFGKRVRELRKARKLTQEQLAEIIGLGSKQIGNIETGAGFTTMATLEKLAKVFGIEMFQLFNFSHNDSRENLEQDLIALIKHSSDEDLRLISKLVNSILK